jgi:CobQ-like glutamine amidotransferase family enzyme
VFEQNESYFIPAFGTDQQVKQVSRQIVNEPAIVELADEDMVVLCLCSSVQWLFNQQGLAGKKIDIGCALQDLLSY